MKSLLLKLEINALAYGFFPPGKKTAALQGAIPGIRSEISLSTAFQQLLSRIEAAGYSLSEITIGLHVAAGGQGFDTHTEATPDVIEKLRTRIPSAPMHLPAVLELIKCADRHLPSCPVMLFFDTAFFKKLPAREYLYAIDADALEGTGIRRYGYHGLFHEAATQAAEASADPGQPKPEKIISICLEPRPEMAAVLNGKPVMVSGGATPLEGLPGQTSCGDIDSGVVLTLARKEQAGPEQLNQMLSRQSGMLALAGRPVTIEEVLISEEKELALARKVLEYRILLRTGMALAAMDGFDRIVFSGRYAKAGQTLGPRLLKQLPNPGKSPEIDWLCFETPLMQIMAEQIPLLRQPAETTD
ncbi:hypothetical protein [Pontiella agarivorans]|uniref:Acetate kinase n=1 Tax=Pontiella agarivorans TaxID=3038953 RepID=A0ABU5MZ86_9BACT|nr:hypothetical protein [Pontiella agarivorans]MDZ8119511.1 hypothetical protein [Pontiella agarivorans]